MRELTGYLMQDGEPSIESALDVLERSATLEDVLDERTGLYLSGPAHAYEYLREEMASSGGHSSCGT